MNKIIQILVFSYLLVGICDAASASDPRPHADDDHLIPINGRIELEYEKLLNRRLFVTSANYARIVTLASSASVGETALAIYSKGHNADEIFITCTRAKRNLWAAEFGEDPSFPKDPAIGIARRDTAFPKSTAETVTRAIRRMVEKNRPLTKSGRIIVDATDVEFSVEDQKGGRIRALLTPDAGGKNTTALRRLTRLLEEYCEGSPAIKASLARKIETESRQLTR